jgi:hypothetical protein
MLESILVYIVITVSPWAYIMKSQRKVSKAQRMKRNIRKSAKFMGTEKEEFLFLELLFSQNSQ